MNTWNRTSLRVEQLESRLAPATHAVSTNWAGYAVSTNPGGVTHVQGEWIVPAVSNSNAGFSSAWVGMDGWTSSTVEQIGTDSDFVNGQARYYAWYEMFPAAPVTLTMTVSPGDHISASVMFSAPNQFILAISNITTGGSFTTTQTSATAQRSSAEWIQEAPSSFTGVLPLANFGTINFSGASATISGTTGPADNAWAGSTLNQVDMVARRSAIKATTSTISDSGSPAASSFSVTFVSSGARGSKGNGKKGSTLPLSGPERFEAIVSGAVGIPAVAAVAMPAPLAFSAQAREAFFTAASLPVQPTVIASIPILPQLSWGGDGLGVAKIDSNYGPPATPMSEPATPADTSPKPQIVAPPEDDAGPAPLAVDPIPLDRVRISTDL